MKKLLPCFLILVFVVSACASRAVGSGMGSAAQTAPAVPPTESLLPPSNECAEAMCLLGAFSLLELQDRAVDENVLKLFSAAVDATRNRVYVAGIMTSRIGILDAAAETWIGTLEAGFTERAIKYLYLDPAANYLYILDATHTELRRVDLDSGEIVGPVPLPAGGFGQLASVDEIHTRLYLTTSRGLTAFDGHTLDELYTIDGLGQSAGPMLWDENTLYLLDTTSKESKRSIFTLDGDSGQVSGEIRYTVPQGGRSRWLHFDPDGKFFLVGLDRKILQLDLRGQELQAFDLAGRRALEDQVYDPASHRLFVLSIDSPRDGQAAGIGGQVDVYDLNGGLVSSFDFGRKPHHMSLNPANGRIYIPNGDASVLWSIDTRDPTQAAPLRLGDSVEQIVPAADGSLYLSSRLGGSYLARYEPGSGDFEAFTAGTWPIPLRRDASGEHLFALNAWDGTLSVYALTPVQSLLGTLPLGLPAGSTDRLPDLAVDSTRRLAYAAFPEFGQVAVVDWEAMQPVTLLTIPGAQTGDTGGGPGQLQVAVNENEGRVFVYEPKARKLHIFDSDNGHTLAASIDLKEQSRFIGQADADQFFFDAQAGRLFLGALELDGVSGQPTGRSLSQGNKLFGMDLDENLYWVVDTPGSSILAVDRDTLAVRHSQPMPESSSALPTLAYDPALRRIYVGYLSTARVYILAVGDLP